MKRNLLSATPRVYEKFEDTAEVFEYRATQNDFNDTEAISAASDLRRNVYPLQKVPIDLAQLTTMAGVIAIAISFIMFLLLKR